MGRLRYVHTSNKPNGVELGRSNSGVNRQSTKILQVFYTPFFTKFFGCRTRYTVLGRDFFKQNLIGPSHHTRT